jgi:hypothetical protein
MLTLRVEITEALVPDGDPRGWGGWMEEGGGAASGPGIPGVGVSLAWDTVGCG